MSMGGGEEPNAERTSMETGDSNWSKAGRLAIAGAVAPSIRRGAEAARERRVARVDSEGRVVGYATLADVQRGLLERRRIEIDVQPGMRPEEVFCADCGRPAPQKKVGNARKRCERCAAAREKAWKRAKPCEACKKRHLDPDRARAAHPKLCGATKVTIAFDPANGWHAQIVRKAPLEGDTIPLPIDGRLALAEFRRLKAAVAKPMMQGKPKSGSAWHSDGAWYVKVTMAGGERIGRRLAAGPATNEGKAHAKKVAERAARLFAAWGL